MHYKLYSRTSVITYTFNLNYSAISYILIYIFQQMNFHHLNSQIAEDY